MHVESAHKAEILPFGAHSKKFAEKLEKSFAQRKEEGPWRNGPASEPPAPSSSPAALRCTPTLSQEEEADLLWDACLEIAAIVLAGRTKGPHERRAS
jgi:hypothetical protein